MTKYTTYRIATKWCHNCYILCNNIDENLEYLWDYDYEEDIFQYYLTDCSESDVEWLSSTFDLKFAYSPKLDLYVLCVDHFGTSWDYVGCEVKDESWLEVNPDCEYTDSCNPPKMEFRREILRG